MNIYNAGDWKIIGDGNIVAIIIEEDAYVMDKPILTSFGIDESRDLIDITEFGDPNNYHSFIAGLSSTDVTLSLRVNGEIKKIPAKEIKLTNPDDMTISELLFYINKKVEER